MLGRTELLELEPDLSAVATERISLGPLSATEMQALVGHLLEGAEPTPEVTERAAAAGERNPLFVEELLRLLVDQGTLRQEGDSWTTDGPISVLWTPPTIQAIIAARLDRLRPDQRAVIDCAAVIG